MNKLDYLARKNKDWKPWKVKRTGIRYDEMSLIIQSLRFTARFTNENRKRSMRALADRLENPLRGNPMMVKGNRLSTGRLKQKTLCLHCEKWHGMVSIVAANTPLCVWCNNLGFKIDAHGKMRVTDVAALTCRMLPEGHYVDLPTR